MTSRRLSENSLNSPRSSQSSSRFSSICIVTVFHRHRCKPHGCRTASPSLALRPLITSSGVKVKQTLHWMYLCTGMLLELRFQPSVEHDDLRLRLPIHKCCLLTYIAFIVDGELGRCCGWTGDLARSLLIVSLLTLDLLLGFLLLLQDKSVMGRIRLYIPGLTRAACDLLCSSRSSSRVRSLASRSSSGRGVGVRGITISDFRAASDLYLKTKTADGTDDSVSHVVSVLDEGTVLRFLPLVPTPGRQLVTGVATVTLGASASARLYHC